MATPLTQHAIELLLALTCDMQPFLQIFVVEQVNSIRTSTIWYRTTISDGTHMHHTMLPSKFNSLIASGILQQGSIIHLKKWTCAILCQCMYASFFIILTYVFVSSPFIKIIIYFFSYLFFSLAQVYLTTWIWRHRALCIIDWPPNRYISPTFSWNNFPMLFNARTTSKETMHTSSKVLHHPLLKQQFLSMHWAPTLQIGP